MSVDVGGDYLGEVGGLAVGAIAVLDNPVDFGFHYLVLVGESDDFVAKGYYFVSQDLVFAL